VKETAISTLKVTVMATVITNATMKAKAKEIMMVIATCLKMAKAIMIAKPMVI
jgi:hypothetical protein